MFDLLIASPPVFGPFLGRTKIDGADSRQKISGEECVCAVCSTDLNAAGALWVAAALR
jgi:hypothetical protein